MARKKGQIIRRGTNTWLVRVYLGRDPQSGTRKYHNQTIHGPFREAQRFLNLRLQQRDNGPVSRAAVMSLNQLLEHCATPTIQPAQMIGQSRGKSQIPDLRQASNSGWLRPRTGESSRASEGSSPSQPP